MTDSYLEDAALTVTFKITWKVTIGHHPCSVCGVDSPPPTDDQLLDFAMDQSAAFYAAGPGTILATLGTSRDIRTCGRGTIVISTCR